MSEKELVELVLQNVAANLMIATDTGLAAAQKMGEIAALEQIEWALCGGLAMQLYGSDRLTKDVDVVASGILSIEAAAPLTFGGSCYKVSVGNYNVPVDWIVRDDGYQKYYRAALVEAIRLPSGVKIITPEWLVVLKFFAGRQRNLDDIVFLLGRKNGVRVNRSTVKENVVRVAGEDVWLAMLPEFRRLCARADNNTEQPDKYYTEN